MPCKCILTENHCHIHVYIHYASYLRSDDTNTNKSQRQSNPWTLHRSHRAATYLVQLQQTAQKHNASTIGL